MSFDNSDTNLTLLTGTMTAKGITKVLDVDKKNFLIILKGSTEVRYST